MKNNKGFTLVELLAVIFLLSLILLISFPNFNKLSNTAKKQIDNSTKILLKSATKMYVDNFSEDVEEYLTDKSYMCVPIGKLMAYDFVDSDLKDSNGNPLDKRKCINVSKSTSNGKTVYNYDASLINQIPNGIDYIPPVISLEPTAANPNESVIKCNQVMNTTYENFIANCNVKVTDDKDASVRLEEPTRYDMKNDEEEVIKILLEYNAIDVTGNKSLPFKVQLNLN